MNLRICVGAKLGMVTGVRCIIVRCSSSERSAYILELTTDYYQHHHHPCASVQQAMGDVDYYHSLLW